jgi:hypothetical protein
MIYNITPWESHERGLLWFMFWHKVKGQDHLLRCSQSGAGHYTSRDRKYTRNVVKVAFIEDLTCTNGLIHS